MVGKRLQYHQVADTLSLWSGMVFSRRSLDTVRDVRPVYEQHMAYNESFECTALTFVKPNYRSDSASFVVRADTKVRVALLHFFLSG